MLSMQQEQMALAQKVAELKQELAREQHDVQELDAGSDRREADLATELRGALRASERRADEERAHQQEDVSA